MFVFSATINGDEPSLYKIVWDSPSKNVYGTMPLGNGEVALNTWIDEVGDFKLNAPHKTTIEGQLKNGKLINLKVTPKEREKDVRILLEK
jgi:hypothetical protein